MHSDISNTLPFPSGTHILCFHLRALDCYCSLLVVGIGSQDWRQCENGLCGILAALLVIPIEEAHSPCIGCQHIKDVVGKAWGRVHLLQEEMGCN